MRTQHSQVINSKECMLRIVGVGCRRPWLTSLRNKPIASQLFRNGRAWPPRARMDSGQRRGLATFRSTLHKRLIAVNVTLMVNLIDIQTEFLLFLKLIHSSSASYSSSSSSSVGSSTLTGGRAAVAAQSSMVLANMW